jgi:hypothetical protein
MSNSSFSRHPAGSAYTAVVSSPTRTPGGRDRAHRPPPAAVVGALAATGSSTSTPSCCHSATGAVRRGTLGRAIEAAPVICARPHQRCRHRGLDWVTVHGCTGHDAGPRRRGRSFHTRLRGDGNVRRRVSVRRRQVATHADTARPHAHRPERCRPRARDR